ncbi:hypothetical protein F4604DRAFT_1687796 [Suillus subluteus]|nr:hypothetical protein F4604DRAFT_1687796 [Suillus subluteus]
MNLIPNDLRVFFPLTREGNYTQIRRAAFDSLFTSKWYTPAIMRYMMNSIKDTELLFIEEDGSLPEKSKEVKKSEVDMMIKVLRKDREISKNKVLREFLMFIALAPDIDQEVRWGIIKLADIVLRGVEETSPKVTIHLRPTSMTEAPPSLPAVKVLPKVSRPLKSGGPPARVLAVASSAPKLKIMPGNTQAQSSNSFVTASTIPMPPVRAGSMAPPQVPAKAKAKAKPNPMNGVRPPHIPKAQSAGMICMQAVMHSRNSRCIRAQCFSCNQWILFETMLQTIARSSRILSAMGAKVKAGMCEDRFAFEADFRLMIANARQYNPSGMYAHTEAIFLETFLEKRYSTLALQFPATLPLPPNRSRAESPPSTPLPSGRTFFNHIRSSSDRGSKRPISHNTNENLHKSSTFLSDKLYMFMSSDCVIFQGDVVGVDGGKRPFVLFFCLSWFQKKEKKHESRPVYDDELEDYEEEEKIWVDSHVLFVRHALQLSSVFQSYTIICKAHPDTVGTKLAQHRDTWFAQDNVNILKAASINTIRVPCRGLGWLKDAGIQAILDHRALPGVQMPGQIFTGKLGSRRAQEGSRQVADTVDSKNR